MKNTGTLVKAGLKPYDDQDQFPTHYSSYGVGGVHKVANQAARDALPAYLREEGMFVYLEDTELTYQLAGGITNGDWSPATPGAGIAEEAAARIAGDALIRSDLDSTDTGKGAELVANTFQMVRLIDHTVTGSGDETAKVQAAITSALAKGIRYIYVHTTVTVSGTLTNRANIVWVGPGKLIGAGAYRVRVHPLNSETLPEPFFGDFDANRHLQRLKISGIAAGNSGTSTAVVAFVGDSLLTPGAANPLGRQSTLADLLERKFRADNKLKSFTFYNRAISGETWATANDVPLTFPPWYTTPATAWLDYVSRLAPDVVVLSFGMNDAAAFSYFSFQQVISKIRAFDDVTTTTTAAFTQPAVNANVAVAVTSSTGFLVGHVYLIGTGGRYEVVSVDSGIQITFKNLGTGAAPAASIASASVIYKPNPDIIICTPMVPTLEPHANFATYGTKDIGQVSRDWNAGYVRDYCHAYGIGLLDINRFFNIARDGRDICQSELERIATDLDVSGTGAYQASINDECSDFRLDFRLTGSSAQLAAIFDGTGGGTLSVKMDGGYFGYGRLTLSSLNNSGTPTGNIWARFYITDTTTTIDASGSVASGGEDTDTGNLGTGQDTGIAVPTVATTYIIERRGQRVTIRTADSSYVADLFTKDGLVMHGGEFAPAVGWYQTAYATGPVSTVSCSVGRYRDYMPTLINSEIWGVGAATADTQLPNGGNGVNHPTSRGANEIYNSILSQVSFYAEYPAFLRTYDPANTLGGTFFAGGALVDGNKPNGNQLYIGTWGNASWNVTVNNIVRMQFTTNSIQPLTNNGINLGTSALRVNTAFISSLDTANVKATNIQTYVDNAAAIAAGRVAGDFYKVNDGSGNFTVKVVV